MNIVTDINQPLANEAFSKLGKVTLLKPEEITREALKEANALICRSTIKVNRELLEGTPVEFVGACIIGTDHADLEYLKEKEIAFYNAPGCNANSVAEYVIAAILEYSLARNWPLAGKTIGIVGVGNVGSRLQKKAAALGLRVLLNDPPRERAEGQDGFTTLNEIIAQSDIVSLHVPLIREGQDRTCHLAGKDFFGLMREDALFINASRGKVVKQDALESALRNRLIGGAILDVFENEPEIPSQLHDNLFIATPHIAGHSFNGKTNGTLQIFQKACEHFNVQAQFDAAPLMPEPEIDLVEIESCGCFEEDINVAVQSCYDILRDDCALREAPQEFYQLRSNYPVRLEFGHTTVQCDDPKILGVLQGLGFKKAVL